MALGASLRIWVAGARPRTLPASIVPVVVGTAAADAVENGQGLIWWRAVLALLVGLSLQVGVNYANDYSDGIRGTDASRVGPLRLTASGAATAEAVKRAAFIAFGVAAGAGLVLALATSWWLIAVGAVCILAAWYYTGGSRPYGYRGWGELSVFVFFGLVATTGSAFVQDETITFLAAFTGVPMGLLAVALIVVNNLRDLPLDAQAGKLTLAVRFGDKVTRGLYFGLLAAAFLWLPYLVVARPWALLAFLAVPLAVMPVRAVMKGYEGVGLIPVLGRTALLQVAFGALLTVGLTLGG